MGSFLRTLRSHPGLAVVLARERMTPLWAMRLHLELRGRFPRCAHDLYALAEALCTGDHFGRPFPQDLPRAARFYRAAALRGDRDAMWELAWMHMLGEGIPRDLAEAERWFAQAAASGHTDAMRVLCDTGVGLPVRPEQIERWQLALAAATD